MKKHTSSARILLWKKKTRRDPRNHEKKDGGTEKVRGGFPIHSWLPGDSIRDLFIPDRWRSRFTF